MKKKLFATLFSTLTAISLGICMDYISQNNRDIPVSAYTEQYNETENNPTGWGIKKEKGREPEIPDYQKNELSQFDAYYMDTSRPKKMYLTFDEGYENGQTEKILDTLKEKNVPAAFFITGQYAKTQGDIIRRMIDEGHIIGNHTVNHPNLAKLSDAEKMASELNELNDAVYSEYGYKMKYMRPPEGVYSKRVLAVAKDCGYTTVFWSFAYKDWESDVQRGPEYAVNEVVPYFHDGAIILLHAVSSDNALALGTIIDEAKKMGYEFDSLDSLQK